MVAAPEHPLARYGTTVPTTVLADHIQRVHADLADLSRARRFLLQAGLSADVTVDTHSRDRDLTAVIGWRVKRIVITDAGHRLYAELKNEVATVRQQLPASIELEKLEHLTELLEQMQSILQRYHDCASVRSNCHETLDCV
jgi:hypothetical protein